MRIMKAALPVLSLFFGVLNSSVFGSERVDKSPVPIGYLQELKIEAGDLHHPVKAYQSRFDMQFSPKNSVKPPSKRKAVLMSLLLPGLGERSIGSYTSAKVFYSSESTLWLFLFLSQKRKEWKKEDYQVYAAVNAGVDNDGKSEQFYSDVSNFSDVDEFNAAIRRSRNPRSVYNSTDEFWSWGSEEERLKFKSLKLESDKADLNIKRTIGVLLINRILSVMNTIYKYNKMNSTASMSMNMRGLPELKLSVKF